MNKLNTIGVSSAIALSSLFGATNNQYLKDKKKKDNRKKNKLSKVSRKRNRD